MNKLEDFKEGLRVRYVPTHAEGNPSHQDCENGIVSSTNSKYVFVKYIKNNVLQETSAATLPEDLILWK